MVCLIVSSLNGRSVSSGGTVEGATVGLLLSGAFRVVNNCSCVTNCCLLEGEEGGFVGLVVERSLVCPVVEGCIVCSVVDCCSTTN